MWASERCANLKSHVVHNGRRKVLLPLRCEQEARRNKARTSRRGGLPECGSRCKKGVRGCADAACELPPPPSRPLESANPAKNEVKAKLDSARPSRNQNPRQQELKNEIAEINSKWAAKKAARGQAEDQIKALHDSINVRVKELNAKKGNMPHKTLADLEAAVQKLDQKVATGQMKIVDERKAVQEINLLNRRKKDFAVVEEMQNSIDADRTKLKAMKDQKQDPELKELNDRYDALDKEFKEIKAEQDSVYFPLPLPLPTVRCCN